MSDEPARSPADAERKWKNVGRNFIIRSVVISDLCVELRVALAQLIGEASADILAECVGTSASRYDVHAPDRASIPPGPVRIADDTQTGRRGFTRAMVPTYSTDHVC